jgi:hypothetical protein
MLNPNVKQNKDDGLALDDRVPKIPYVRKGNARRQDSILERLGRARHAMGTAIVFLRLQYARILFMRWLKL